jgi:transcriptional regulator with XRE-family HTH domain
MISRFIIKLRKKNNFTQEFLASKLGITRQTYMSLEEGKRDLKVEEAKKLAEVFNISIEDFLNEKETKITVNIEKECNNQNTKNSKKEEIRISIPQKNLKKFKEILLYILAKVGAKPNVGETVLYKLLYFIDFDYYEKYEEQLIGATYQKNTFGPTPLEFETLIKDMVENNEIVKVNNKYFKYSQKKYLPTRDANLSVIDGRELGHIEEVLNRLSDKNATELTEYSHEDVPWIVTENHKPIEYEAVFYRTSKTSVRNYDEDK